MAELAYDVFQTRFGWVGVLVSSRGVRGSTTPRATPEEALERLGAEARTARHDSAAVAVVRQRLERFFQGEPVRFDDLPLDTHGWPRFFAAAWEACRTIPAGETRSYAWLAAQAGNPAAVRAAGQAMARNRLAPIVPCHRVIGSHGGLHGYGGGLELKAHLLEMERRLAAARGRA